jgi:hypothetical protein
MSATLAYFWELEYMQYLEYIDKGLRYTCFLSALAFSRQHPGCGRSVVMLR